MKRVHYTDSYLINPQHPGNSKSDRSRRNRFAGINLLGKT